MFKQAIGALLLVAGLIAMAGSDGMCGGHVCGPNMPPNTIGEMLMIALIGLTLFATGAIIIATSERP